MKPIITKRCEICDIVFQSYMPHAKYCGDTCRVVGRNALLREYKSYVSEYYTDDFDELRRLILRDLE